MSTRGLYKEVECPWCGETILIKAIDGNTHKCKFCKRLFKIFVSRRGKSHLHVDVECADFNESGQW